MWVGVAANIPTRALRDYLPRLIPVEVHESKAKVWFESLLGGVHFLHSHKVSHNDIKYVSRPSPPVHHGAETNTLLLSPLRRPANILLTSTCTPVLVDFGFAEHYSPHKTPKDRMFLSNLAYGTPEYLSPERAKGILHDTRLSDMYSLGVTFFEILIGRTPFEEIEGEAFETQEDLERYWLRTKKGVWLGEDDWRARLSKGVQQLLRRMTAPEVADRVDAAGALADPYWRTDYEAIGDESYLMAPPGIISVPTGGAATILDQHATAAGPVPTPTKTPKAPLKAAAGQATKKKSKSKLKKQRSKTSTATPQRPVTAPTSASPSLGYTIPAVAPGIVSPFGTLSSSTAPRQRNAGTAKRRPVTAAAFEEGSDKENALASSQRKKAPSRKPIPGTLQPKTISKPKEEVVSRARVASIANKSAVFGHVRNQSSVSSAKIPVGAVQKHLDGKTGSVLKHERDMPKHDASKSRDMDAEEKVKHRNSRVLVDLTGTTRRGVCFRAACPPPGCWLTALFSLHRRA